MKWIQGITGGTLLGFVALACILGPVRAEGFLIFCLMLLWGWVGFLIRVPKHIRVDFESILTLVISLLVLTIGFHLTATWFCSLNRLEKVTWRWHWTVSLLGMFMLAFVAGLAVIGIVQQYGWMLSSKEIWFEKRDMG